MATVFGVNFQKTLNIPRDMIEANTWNGRVRCLFDTYEAVSLAIGSTISVGKLPKDARVVGVQLMFDALGASSILSVGDAAVPGRYVNGISSASAGVSLLGVISGLGFKQTANTDIIITTGGATITGSISILTSYVID